MTLDYFYGQAGELFSFFRIPKALFQEQRFQNLSTDAKILYGILLDRRDQQLHFRVSKPELERIRNKMESCGILSIGSYLRKMAHCLQLDLPQLRRMAYLLQMCSLHRHDAEHMGFGRSPTSIWNLDFEKSDSKIASWYQLALLAGTAYRKTPVLIFTSDFSWKKPRRRTSARHYTSERMYEKEETHLRRAALSL